MLGKSEACSETSWFKRGQLCALWQNFHFTNKQTKSNGLNYYFKVTRWPRKWHGQDFIFKHNSKGQENNEGGKATVWQPGVGDTDPREGTSSEGEGDTLCLNVGSTWWWDMGKPRWEGGLLCRSLQHSPRPSLALSMWFLVEGILDSLHSLVSTCEDFLNFKIYTSWKSLEIFQLNVKKEKNKQIYSFFLTALLIKMDVCAGTAEPWKAICLRWVTDR